MYVYWRGANCGRRRYDTDAFPHWLSRQYTLSSDFLRTFLCLKSLPFYVKKDFRSWRLYKKRFCFKMFLNSFITNPSFPEQIFFFIRKLQDANWFITQYSLFCYFQVTLKIKKVQRSFLPLNYKTLIQANTGKSTIVCSNYAQEFSWKRNKNITREPRKIVK